MTWSKQQKRKWVRCYLLLLFVFHNWCWSSLAVPGYNLLNLNYCEPYVNTFIGKSRLYKGRFYWSKFTMKRVLKFMENGIKTYWRASLATSATNFCVATATSLILPNQLTKTSPQTSKNTYRKRLRKWIKPNNSKSQC